MSHTQKLGFYQNQSMLICYNKGILIFKSEVSEVKF